MGKKVKQRDKRLEVAKQMPPLRRTRIGKGYDANYDEVLRWVGSSTDCAMYLVDLLARIGYIKYNSENGTWEGVEHGQST